MIRYIVRNNLKGYTPIFLSNRNFCCLLDNKENDNNEINTENHEKNIIEGYEAEFKPNIEYNLEQYEKEENDK
mgnify:CR=1 FL=1